MTAMFALSTNAREHALHGRRADRVGRREVQDQRVALLLDRAADVALAHLRRARRPGSVPGTSSMAWSSAARASGGSESSSCTSPTSITLARATSSLENTVPKITMKNSGNSTEKNSDSRSRKKPLHHRHGQARQKRLLMRRYSRPVSVQEHVLERRAPAPASPASASASASAASTGAGSPGGDHRGDLVAGDLLGAGERRAPHPAVSDARLDRDVHRRVEVRGPARPAARAAGSCRCP